jgi:hypothetical protein
MVLVFLYSFSVYFSLVGSLFFLGAGRFPLEWGGCVTNDSSQRTFYTHSRGICTRVREGECLRAG